jgi:hypothetical protein
VECGIGGFKQKWRCFMKRFDARKPKFSHLFQASVFVINFLHLCQMDFTYKVIADITFDPIAQGWVKDY